MCMCAKVRALKSGVVSRRRHTRFCMRIYLIIFCAIANNERILTLSSDEEVFALNNSPSTLHTELRSPNSCSTVDRFLFVHFVYLIL